MSDPRSGSRTWVWIAGMAVLVLIAIFLVGGWNSNTHLPPAATTDSATVPVTPPASATVGAPAAHPVMAAAPKQ